MVQCREALEHSVYKSSSFSSIYASRYFQKCQGTSHRLVYDTGREHPPCPMSPICPEKAEAQLCPTPAIFWARDGTLITYGTIHSLSSVGEARLRHPPYWVAPALSLCASSAERTLQSMRDLKIDHSICDIYEAQGAKRTAAQARDSSLGLLVYASA